MLLELFALVSMYLHDCKSAWRLVTHKTYAHQIPLLSKSKAFIVIHDSLAEHIALIAYEHKCRPANAHVFPCFIQPFFNVIERISDRQISWKGKDTSHESHAPIRDIKNAANRICSIIVKGRYGRKSLFYSRVPYMQFDFAVTRF
jgi:hypothetical protein